MHNYLTQQTAKSVNEFEVTKHPELFDKIMEVCLCRTLVLKRRRTEETQFELLKDFKNIEQYDTESDLYLSLNNTEKMLTKSMKRIEVRGKRGRIVLVMFTEDLYSTLTIFVNYRTECGFNESNQYLFCSSKNIDGYFKADNVLRNGKGVRCSIS